MPLETRIRDVMRSIDHYGVVDETSPLKLALQMMHRTMDQCKPACLVAVGDSPAGDEVIKGFITPSDIVFGIAGHFLKGAEKTGAIFWEGQLEGECLLALEKQVDTILQPIQVCIRDDEMLMEAVFLFNKYQVDILPVLCEEEVSGLIHLDDLIAVISRIGIANGQKQQIVNETNGGELRS